MADNSNIEINFVGTTSRLRAAATQAQQTIQGVTGNVVASGAAMNTSAGYAGKFTGQFTQMYGPIAAATAALGAFTLGARTIIEFEDTMLQVKAVTETSTAQLEAMELEARKLGASTQFSATQAAQGLKELALAGFTAEQATGSLAATMALAAVDNLDMGQAAQITASIMKGFGLSAADSQRAVDVLAQAASTSSAGVVEMGESMKFAAPFAAALGLSLEESAAAVMVLAESGIRGGNAGRGLTSVWGQMINLTPMATAALKGYGVTADMVNPRIVGQQQALENLANVDISALAKAFGTANTDIIVSLIKGRDSLAKFNNELDNAEGRAKTTADIMNQSLKKAIDEVGGAFEELAISAGKAGILDMMKDLAVGAQEAIKAITPIVSALVKINEVASYANPVGLALKGVEMLGGRKADEEEGADATDDTTVAQEGLTAAVEGTASAYVETITQQRNMAKEGREAAKEIAQAMQELQGIGASDNTLEQTVKGNLARAKNAAVEALASGGVDTRGLTSTQAIGAKLQVLSGDEGARSMDYFNEVSDLFQEMIGMEQELHDMAEEKQNKKDELLEKEKTAREGIRDLMLELAILENSALDDKDAAVQKERDALDLQQKKNALRASFPEMSSSEVESIAKRQQDAEKKVANKDRKEEFAQTIASDLQTIGGGGGFYTQPGQSAEDIARNSLNQLTEQTTLLRTIAERVGTSTPLDIQSF